MEKIIFIILHSKSDNAEIMINPYAIESVRQNMVCLHESYYEVSESCVRYLTRENGRWVKAMSDGVWLGDLCNTNTDSK